MSFHPIETAVAYRKIGPYILLRKIASGGMGELFLAKSTKVQGIEKYLVVKQVLPHLSGSADLNSLFINEARINMNLNHSNIVTIFDFGIEEGRFFIAMEYIHGISLKKFTKTLEGRHLELDESVYIIAQTARGLSYAHRCKDFSSGQPLNIIHRDVSPDNIMIDTEGSIKIIDFGIALNTDTGERSMREGKYSYMSPEQALGKKELTPQTDIFSLGIVLWELIAKRRLYTSPDPSETLKKATQANIPNIKDIAPETPDEMDKILARALAKDPRERYVTMECFYDDLNEFLNREYPRFSQYSIREHATMVFNDDFKPIDFTLTELDPQPSLSRSQPNEYDATQLADSDNVDRHSFKRRLLTRRTVRKRRRVKKKKSS